MRVIVLGLVVQCVVLALSASAVALPSPGNLTPVVLDAGGLVLHQGWAVDISGDRAIIGAIGYSEAFIFDLSTGQLVHRLSPNDVAANDLFGFSVAIDGNLAVVASGQKNAAYVFDVTTGQQLHKLVSTSNTTDFVRSVDVSNGIAVLGTPSNTGAAILYNAYTGTQIKRISGPTTFFKQGFGTSVSIDGDTVAVTSPSSAGGRGDIHVLDALTGNLRWSYGYNTTGEQFFLRDVVVDSDKVVVSGGEFFPSNVPSAYVFDRATGTLLREIDIQVTSEDNYSSQIDLSGDILVVGAPGVGSLPGAAHFFDVNTGDFLNTVSSPNTTGDSFGIAIALENQRLVIGASRLNSSRGIAYAYHLVPEPAALTFVLLTAGVWAGRMRR
jgi:outer membrane protein assembly factor BamB